MTTRPTKEQMEAMETAVDACLDGGRGFQWGPCHPDGGFASPEEVIEYMAGAVRRSVEATPERALELWSVHVSKGDESLFVCHTGNGPTSEAHAKFIAIAPWAIKALLAEVGALSAEREEALAAAHLLRAALDECTSAPISIEAGVYADMGSGPDGVAEAKRQQAMWTRAIDALSATDALPGGPQVGHASKGTHEQ